MTQKKTLTTRDIAAYCDVTQRTAIQWINEGKIRAHRTPGKHIRINIGDFVDFLERFQMPLPDDLKRDRAQRAHKIKRVLIVDDDAEMVNSVKRVLLKEQLAVEVAHDGFAAGLRFNDFSPDLILLDIKMPGFNGYQVCENIRQNPKNSSTKILIISGMIDEAGIRKIRNAGADDVLAKPFDNKELLRRVKQLLGWTQRSGDAPQ